MAGECVATITAVLRMAAPLTAIEPMEFAC
jgi:hypothetical protein